MQEPVCSRKPGFFPLSVGCEGVLGGEDGVGEEGGFVAADHVDVGGLDVVGVEEACYTCDHHAPVAALGYCSIIGWLDGGDNMRGPNRGEVPYLLYPSLSMSL